MSLLGNIIWLVFGGFFVALGYMAMGLLLCLTIVGIPFGIAAIKLGLATLTPFGKSVELRTDASGVLRIVFNVIWLLLAGWEIALAHLAIAAVLAVTIIGLPFALQHIKLIPMALLPFGYEFVEAPALA